MANPIYKKIKEGEYEEIKEAKKKILLSDIDRSIQVQDDSIAAAEVEKKRLKDFKKMLEALPL